MSTHINATDDVKKTVDSDCRRVDGTTSNGRIKTTITSYGTGANLYVLMATSDGTAAPRDNVTLAELFEYAADMKAHWEAVLAKLAEAAEQLAGGSTES